MGPRVFQDDTPEDKKAIQSVLSGVLAAAQADPAIKQAMIDGAKEAEATLVTPLFQFRNYGQQLPHHWSTISNESAFGTDYFTRTAVAKSNILVNSPNETKYFYQDLDEQGNRLNSARRYTVTFAANGTPPVHGFWSLSVYNEHHFFVANSIQRFSVGTKNKTLQTSGNDDSRRLRSGRAASRLARFLRRRRLQIDLHVVDLAGEGERQLVGEVDRRTDVHADVKSFTE